MSDTVIQVENLGKKYTIAHQRQERYATFRDAIVQGVKLVSHVIKPRLNNGFRSKNEEFWALKDVSFEVKKGDRVGIIGRNGAGKSTLLKILSRITEPSRGRITIKGRVASLLEVGTGFHPELTGRENIFLNGAILGMSKVEIKRQFDEIVAFAEVEKFLDTPVKRYSSGMYVRLAFAVAAHLEPEVLVVDEVLAVGDISFQKKCLGKMENVGKEGRTVLFVSHNMSAIEKLCDRAILLNAGRLLLDDSPKACIFQYLNLGNRDVEGNLAYSVQRNALKSVRCAITIQDIIILSELEIPKPVIYTGDFLIVRIVYRAEDHFLNSSIAFVVSLKSYSGQEIFRLSTLPISGFEINKLEPQGYIDLKIPKLPVTAGSYLFDIAVTKPNIEFLFKLESVVSLEVSSKDIYGSGVSLDQSRGLLVLPHSWSHSPSPKAHELR